MTSASFVGLEAKKIGQRSKIDMLTTLVQTNWARIQNIRFVDDLGGRDA